MKGLAIYLLNMRQNHKKHQSLKWSFRTNFWGAILIVLLISIVVLIFLKKSIWVELEVIVGIVSIINFSYLFYVLYHGIRFDNDEKYTITWKPVDGDALSFASPIIDTGLGFTCAGAEAGILGLIVGFFLDIIVSILLSLIIAVFLWVGLNIVITAIIVVSMPLYYFFRRSLRYIVAKGRRCYRDIKQSIYFAFKSTIINAIWLYCIIFVGHYFSNKF